MWNFNPKLGWKTLLQTGAFTGYRLGIFFGIAALHIAALWIGAVLGALIGRQIGMQGLMAALLGYSFLIASGLGMYFLRSHILWMVRAGHVGLMAKLIHGEELPKSPGQIAQAKAMLTAAYGDRANLWDLHGSIAASLKGITGKIQGLATLFGDKTTPSGPGKMGPLVGLALRPAPAATLSHGLRKGLANPWDAGRDALVLHTQNGLPIVCNALSLSIITWGAAFTTFILLIWMIILPGPGLIWLGTIGILTWWLKASVIEPFVMACYLQIYIGATRAQQAHPGWASHLDGEIPAFRAMAGRAAPQVSAPPEPAAGPASGPAVDVLAAPAALGAAATGGALLHPLTGQPMKPLAEAEPTPPEPEAPAPEGISAASVLLGGAAPEAPADPAPATDASPFAAPTPNPMLAEAPAPASQPAPTPAAEPAPEPAPIPPAATAAEPAPEPAPLAPTPPAPQAPPAPAANKTVIAPMPVLPDPTEPAIKMPEPPMEEAEAAFSAPQPEPAPMATDAPQPPVPPAPAPKPAAPEAQKTVIGAPLPVFDENDNPVATPAESVDDTVSNPWATTEDTAPEAEPIEDATPIVGADGFLPTPPEAEEAETTPEAEELPLAPPVEEAQGTLGDMNEDLQETTSEAISTAATDASDAATDWAGTVAEQAEDSIENAATAPSPWDTQAPEAPAEPTPEEVTAPMPEETAQATPEPATPPEPTPEPEEPARPVEKTSISPLPKLGD
ncbi:hypothetical protein IV417_02370 [Alphaproteobacteria bacterium KMM 3653]|uniref:Uncharacterized protein n=1 Tax=Harenicola maris TaxID=2841044 RepID=A0AAP2G787_9RHOB|nr:hypothetical protein [Harenicola maris]